VLNVPLWVVVVAILVGAVLGAVLGAWCIAFTLRGVVMDLDTAAHRLSIHAARQQNRRQAAQATRDSLAEGSE